MIPQYVSSGNKYNAWTITSWRAELSHCGFVLATSLKAAVHATPIRAQDFPIVVIYCACYVILSWWVYYTRGVFHYFFLDPRYKYALVAYVGLQFLLTAFYFGAYTLLWFASTSSVGGLIIMLAALGVCSWRAPRDVVHHDDERMTIIQGWGLFWRANMCC